LFEPVRAEGIGERLGVFGLRDPAIADDQAVKDRPAQGSLEFMTIRGGRSTDP
jgi:hypothetical protein